MTNPCTERQKILADETSCGDCPAYERAQGNARKCGPDTCTATEKILEIGKCEKCPDF